MADNPNELTSQERAELEQLRAEKAARDEAAAAARERAELEQLRTEQARAERDAEEDRRIEAARKRMEPGDDLKMPLPQKIILAACVVIFALLVWYFLFR